MWDMWEERSEENRERRRKRKYLEGQAKYKRRPAVVFEIFLEDTRRSTRYVIPAKSPRIESAFRGGQQPLYISGLFVIANSTVLTPFCPPEIRIHTDYAHYTLIYAAERIPTDNVELEFCWPFSVPFHTLTSSIRSSY